MPRLDAIYRRLQDIDDPSVDQAMAAALPSADPLAARLIALLLLRRGRSESSVSLVLHFHHLPADIQQTVIAHAHDLYRPLREASDHRQTSGPANAVDIIRRSRRPKLAYLVADQMRRGSLVLRQSAGQCLLELAGDAITDPAAESPPHFDVEEAGYLIAAVYEAMLSFVQHQQDSVALAAMALLPRPWLELRGILATPNHAATEAVARLLQSAREPLARRALLMMLAQPNMRDAARAGLAQCMAEGSLDEPLRYGHMLLLRPAVNALAEHPPAANWVPALPACEKFDPLARAMLPAWIDALPLSATERLHHLVELGCSRDPVIRLGVLRRLVALSRDAAALTRQARSNASAVGPAFRPPSHPADEHIAAFCDDEQLPLARLSLRHLIRAKYPGLPRMLTGLLSSPHEPIQVMARRQLAAVGFGRFWEAWPRLDEARRLAAGRALLKIDPGFQHHLSDKLLHSRRSTRLRALAMIHALNQGHDFEAALTQMALHDDKVIASAAVKALGSAASETAVDVLEQSLDHRDSRVRANAVEALAQLRSTRHVRKLVEMADNDENRPRANAIQALMDMRTGDAVHALDQMLNDNRPAHRTSALWLVETIGLLDVARHVAEMSVSDADTSVRDRAHRVIHELIDLMQPPGTPTPGSVPGSNPAPASEPRRVAANQIAPRGSGGFAVH